jgi:two-component system cell cycle response regulator
MTSVLEELPEDLPAAAEAALDDLITNAGDIPRYKTADPAREPERRRPPPPPRAKSTVVELGEAQRKRPRAPSASTFDEDDAHAFGQPVLPPPPAAAPNRVATLSGLDLDEDDDADDAAEPDGNDAAAAPEPEQESDEPQPLRFAVFEEADHLAAARSAIVASGHSVAINASSQSGAQKISEAIVAGQVDAVLVGLSGDDDGLGESIVASALALEPQRPLVIASYAGKATQAIKRGVAAGADLAVVRPHDADRMAPILLAASRLHRVRRIAQNARGAELVLRAKLEEISDPEPRGLQPFETFQRVLELEFKRARRFEYPLSVALFAIEIAPPPPPAGIRGILRARAGNALIHTIRDVDVATQLDHERFLVLLPYTDLSGAAGLGRRVIAAVAEGEPVISAGRSFPPRVVGAVAQAKAGETLSFAKLMKDATRALDQARRDGAELAVQP